MARRSWRVVALALGVSMTALGSGLLFLGVRESAQTAADLDQQLTTASEGSAILLSEFFDRAVGSDLQLAAEPVFPERLRGPWFAGVEGAAEHPSPCGFAQRAWPRSSRPTREQ